MSMEITNNYGNYITGYANAAKKTGSTESKNEEEKGVKTSTVELKTSTHGVTKTAQIKTGFSNVSSAFLKKSMNDPEKAKYLEENLEAIPDCAKKTLTSCLGTVTNQTWSIDANGNITATVSGTSDSDGKIARENAERKAKEKKTAEEKAAERRAEKKTAEEKAAKKRAEKAQAEEQIAKTGANEISISATGNGVENVTKSIISAMSTSTGEGVTGFDVKA